MKFKSLLFGCLAAVLSSTACLAQTAPAASPCADDKLVIGSGTANGAYAQIMRPLAERCKMICENRNTQGGFDNVTKLIRNEFDGGIAQVDTLQLLARNYPGLKDTARSLFPMHGSSMHILAMSAGYSVKATVVTPGRIYGQTTSTVTTQKQIATLRDLTGLPVAAWSSAATTMEIVNARLNLGMQIIEVGDRATGFQKLKAGEVAAFVGAGGFPLDWVEKPDGKPGDGVDGMVMVDVENKDFDRIEKPYYQVKVIYRSIGAIGLNTISVRNEMIVRDLQDGDRAAAIESFRACFKDNLRAIKASRGVHPAWADISGSMETAWTPYQSSTPAGGPIGPMRPSR